MKKINLLLLLLVGGLTFMSSCKPDENTDVKPSMTFSTDGAAINADKTVALNAPLLFKISSIENPNTKKNLKTLRVQSFKDNSPNIDSTITINGPSHIASLNFNADDSTYSLAEKFIFTLTDKTGEVETKTIIITTEEEPVATGEAISTYTATLLGAQDNATEGSFLDVRENVVYLQAGANTNSDKIDMIYFHGASNAHTLASPSDETVGGTGSNFDLAEGFSTQNETNFAISSVTATDFDAMTDDVDFPTSISTDTKVNNLAVGNIIEFLTHDGKIGLIKVTDITGTGTGTITFTVKIQD